MDLQVVHHHECLGSFTFLLEPLKEWQEGVNCVGACEGFGVDQPVVNAQGTNHGNGLPSLVRQRHLHPILQPHSTWGHPQVEGRLVDVHDVDFGLVLQQVRDHLRELALLMLQLHLPSGFGAVDDLGLPEGRPMLQ
ncbi:MAG: hypothetical protein ACKO7B_13005, partial [Flavobacteriales bacterium]